MPWNWRPVAALAVAVGAEVPEAEPEAPALVREPVPVAEAPEVPVAEPEVAVAVTKPEEVELAVTLEMSAENESAQRTFYTSRSKPPATISSYTEIYWTSSCFGGVRLGDSYQLCGQPRCRCWRRTSGPTGSCHRTCPRSGIRGSSCRSRTG